ncbi:1-(5-phosphoribosyl)-5-[(5-phosphoribosylamino)methylideneamino]imidazole-4-carboxamide isomerase [Abyssibacter sp.]|jgi:phosphoribosylformimino-5-aminoimidazole carboxamide ribotide isomerase|uniref:1-(5-phosphoribosyl)-5-[(5- phosphoribosylamino)methylideneamino]imidazole-4- carboxamide isomerase n=1 Tax=Abyssibacter sp. TaxID=2320200 RepID=UPI0025C4A226|nr:1-(5-phosphoribosyl)-5-[(5-phosphoribosylamino)methylideneamino]imidazole-4-carboxamide isomerase [Abyssibacter sp.]MCK5858357.1 1-(5-phosphoribosyl)-5-[(5-phosphoribosylamino)methylideneamino]imidazole-4-carboxamide isomerase [Abyssibacter sp.]
MLLIPAIDLKDGQCVRLRQGRMDDVTVFSDDPVDVAKQWIKAGARRLHLVDLDGAKAGEPRNLAAIQAITEAAGDIPVQVGGGIRDEDAVVACLEAGVQYVILGTKVINEPHLLADLCIEFPRHILVGLDVRDGKVAVDGWSKLSQHDLLDLAQHFERDGAEAFIYTDIERDGMMQGVNVPGTKELAEAVAVPVFASGGISSIEDIRALAGLGESGVAGAVIGRALYEGKLDLAEAQAVVDEVQSQS